MASLKETKLFRELENRNDERSRYYRSFIEQVAHDMTPFLENIKALFPEYPDHGINHSLRILDYLGGIIGHELLNVLSSLDIVVLIFAALFHDSAMALYNADKIEKENIRKEHAQKSEQVIDRYFDSCLANLNETSRIKKAVVFVCQAHGLLLEELINDKRFRIVDKVDTLLIHYGILAFLLRIGDLMDLEAERVNNFRMIMFCEDFNDISKKHNLRHQNIDVYNYNPNELEIAVIAEDTAQYRIWDDWFSFLREDLEKFNALYSRDGLFLPNLTSEIKSPSGAKYEVQSLRFEIDEKGGLWDIISQSIYTNELDFVRELLQNAIDASLKTVYNNTDENLVHKSPRSWSGNKSKSIMVCYSEKEKTLCVIDYGIGMDNKDLKDYLFKVSSTGKAACDTRDFEFPGIAQYGIGFVSCLINAETIRLYTSRNGEKLYKVSLENGRNYAFIETQNNSANYIGTSVVLKLRHQFKFSEIENYIATSFVYPSISIRIIDFDKSTTQFQKEDDAISLSLLIDKPYAFVLYLRKKQNEYKPILRELKKEEKRIETILRKHEELFQFYQDNYININIKDNPSCKKYNKKVQAYLELLKECEINNKLKSIELTNALFRYGEDKIAHFITKAFESNSLVLNKELARLQLQISKHTIQMTRVNNEHINGNDGWKYLVALFNEDLEIVDMKMTSDPFSLEHGRGLVLIKHSETDYDLGLEYVAINGFLFCNGKVCNRIVKLAPLYSERYHGRQRSYFTIGINSAYNDVMNGISDYFEEQFYNFDDYDENDDIFPILEKTGFVPFKDSYDEVIIVNNGINKNLEKSIDYPDLSFNQMKSDENSNIKSDLAAVSSRYQAANEMLRILNWNKQLLYQDGIAIPSRLNSLFPMGLFRIECNCTADARMKLNVTRHKASEIRSDVEQWINSIGHTIQERILTKLEEALRALNLYISYKDELWEQKDDMEFFELEALFSLHRIIRNMVSNH